MHIENFSFKVMVQPSRISICKWFKNGCIFDTVKLLRKLWLGFSWLETNLVASVDVNSSFSSVHAKMCFSDPQNNKNIVTVESLGKSEEEIKEKEMWKMLYQGCEGFGNQCF